MPHMCGVGYLRLTPAGIVQSRQLFVVVQAKRPVVLLFLFEHFGTVQCPTLSNSRHSHTACVRAFNVRKRVSFGSQRSQNAGTSAAVFFGRGFWPWFFCGCSPSVGLLGKPLELRQSHASVVFWQVANVCLVVSKYCSQTGLVLVER